jgi:hypothetical protein
MIIERIVARLPALALAGASLVLIAAYPARADEDVGKEVSTAAAHAGFAAAAKDMQTTQMHLHHVVNCLVGSKGEGFDTGVANPCKDQGNGAIPDTKDAAKLTMLRQALAKANAGLKETDMAAAQKDATAAQDMIKMGM